MLFLRQTLNFYLVYQISISLRIFLLWTQFLAKDVNLSWLNDQPLDPNTNLYLRFKVFPMGWSHAVNICQHVLSQIILPSVLVQSAMFWSDQRPIPDLGHGGIVKYVDNVVTLCTNKDVCKELQQDVDLRFQQVGLLVHDIWGKKVWLLWAGNSMVEILKLFQNMRGCGGFA